VTCARTIADSITASIPELYILGSPPASVVAFGSKHPKVNVLEVGDRMAQRGWHLNGLTKPAAVHISCTVGCTNVAPLWGVLSLCLQRLTVDMVDVFIADLKDAVKEAKLAPTGEGTMVAVYGACHSTSFCMNYLSMDRPGQLERGGADDGWAACDCVFGRAVQGLRREDESL
jgi:sphinganine-1-phosphate aldolase